MFCLTLSLFTLYGDNNALRYQVKAQQAKIEQLQVRNTQLTVANDWALIYDYMMPGIYQNEISRAVYLLKQYEGER